jgi:tripartite-type tricarboxylate transporter receptor subunit TctC
MACRYAEITMKRTAKQAAALCVALSLGMAALLSVRAEAADWPAKPVRIVVAYAAGGANDLLARVFAEQLSTAFHQQFFVENRTGGGGLVGDEAVARSEPDGYTLIASGLPSHVLAPAMNPKNAAFDAMRDFTHIAYLGGPPNVFVVHASSPVKSFRDLLAMTRSAPAGVEYVSPSLGSVGNVVAEYVAAKEHLKLVHVAYRGGGAAILDLVAGQVKLGSMTLATTLPHIRSGALRPLAISSAARVPELPDVPTLTELGYPELVVTTWYALSGPARLPRDIVVRLNREVNRAMDVPKVREHLVQETVQTGKMTPEETTAFVQSEIDKWAPAVKAMGIAP